MFYLSDKKKTRRVQYLRCHTCVAVCYEICNGQLCQKQLKDPRVSEEKHCRSQVQKDVICYFEKDCFSAIVRAVSGLKRTDELVFSEIG